MKPRRLRDLEPAETNIATYAQSDEIFSKFTEMVDGRNFSETLFLSRGMHNEGTKAT